MPNRPLVRSTLSVLLLTLVVTGCATTGAAPTGQVAQDGAIQRTGEDGKQTAKRKTGRKQDDSAIPGKSYGEILATGDDAARRGDYRAALMLYGEAQSIDNTSEVWMRIGAAQRHMGLLEGATFSFRSATELDKKNAAAHESLGLVLLALRETAEAKSSLTRALELDDKRWQSHNALGVIADLDGDSTAAIGHYEDALALYPRSQMLLNNLGYSHYLAGHDEQARTYFEAALNLGSYEPAVLNLGLLHARQRSYSQAVEVLTKAVDRPTALNDVGFVAISNGDYGQAQQLLEEAIRLSPVHYETAQRNLALARAETARYAP